MLLVGAASIAFYAAVSATVSGEPSTSAYQGFVAVLLPSGSTFSQDQIKLTAAATVPGGPGQEPLLSYDVAVCGSQPFTGMLLIGGSARLSHMRGIPALGTRTSGASSGLQNLPDLTFQDESTGAVIDLGPVQAVSLTMPSPDKCASSYSTQQPAPPFLGQAQAVIGQAAAPVQRQWRLGWWAGPRTSEDWPLIGNLPGISNQDLGAFRILDGLRGTWGRPLLQYNSVSVGSLKARAFVDQARPELATDTDLAWESSQPLQPNAVVTDTLSMNRWQNWLVWAGIFLGIGGSLLASLLYEWARPSPAHSDHQPNPPQTQAAAQPTKTTLKPLTIIAVVLVILARVIKSGRRTA